mgnify:CR=1 FL=1
MVLIRERSFGLRSFWRIEFTKHYAPAENLISQSSASFGTGWTKDEYERKNHSSGSQAEAEYKAPERGVKYVFNDSGEDVPDVFREHRHQYSQKPEDINAYRRQLAYRCGHIGTKELEIVLSDYLTLNSQKMSYADLEEFDDHILNIENPQLQRYFMNGDDLLPEHDTKYVRAMCDYIEARKTDYANNVPHKLF